MRSICDIRRNPRNPPATWVAYATHMRPHCNRRICPQCTLLTEMFNEYQCRETIASMERRLDDMLALPNDQRQAYSWLAQGADILHGPVAIATVDRDVVDVDFNNAPPDRFHGVVDMIDDLLKVVRKGLKDDSLAEVCPAHCQALR